MNEQYEYSFDMPHSQPENPIPPAYHTPKQQKKEKTTRKIIALALVCAMLGGMIGAGGVIAWNSWQENRVSLEESPENVTHVLMGIRENARIETAAVDTSRLMTPAEVYAANVHSTVGITTSVTTNIWGFQSTSAASGSGFIITEDGYILTNYHVIENANAITVSLYDGTSYEADLVGYDESNDLAVLKVEAEGLPPVILGDSSNLNVGDSVVAIGNPLGELTFTLTSGLVSAKDREVTLSRTVTMNLIQTDCAINSGNSGGALFNLHGEVIGITNAKYSSSSSGASIDNIGFAIPINSVMGIVESIIEKGYIAKPYVGISVLDVSQEVQLYGIPAGAAVQSVTEGSPAAEAGIQIGDIITAVNGTEIDSSRLVDLVASSHVGDVLTLRIYRQGETLEITVTVGEQVQSALANAEVPQPQPQSMQPSTFPFGSR